MKINLYLFLYFIPFLSNAQSEYNFYIEEGNIIWLKDSVFVNSKTDIKSRLLEKLESVDGIEIMNSSRPLLIRAKMLNVNSVKRTPFGVFIQEAVKGEIRLEILSDSYYKIKLTSLVRVFDRQFTFESQILKKKRTVFFNEIFQDLVNKRFLELFILD